MKRINILVGNPQVEKIDQEDFRIDTDELTLRSAAKHIQSIQDTTSENIIKMYISLDHRQPFAKNFIDPDKHISREKSERNPNLSMLHPRIRKAFEPLLQPYGIELEKIHIITEERARSKMRAHMEKFKDFHDRFGICKRSKRKCGRNGCEIETTNEEDDNGLLMEFIEYAKSCYASCVGMAGAVMAKTAENCDEVHSFWPGWDAGKRFLLGNTVTSGIVASYKYFNHQKPIINHVISPWRNGELWEAWSNDKPFPEDIPTPNGVMTIHEWNSNGLQLTNKTKTFFLGNTPRNS